MKMTDSRPKKILASLVDHSVDSITAHDLESALCSSKRARAKRHKLNPTPKQRRLLRWIWQRRITFADSLGMNWMFLGGLLARGFLTWTRDEKTGEFLLHVEKELVIEPAGKGR